jgi:hypothetical protein
VLIDFITDKGLFPTRKIKLLTESRKITVEQIATTNK